MNTETQSNDKETQNDYKITTENKTAEICISTKRHRDVKRPQEEAKQSQSVCLSGA